MSADFQSIAALVVVALAVTWLLLRTFSKRRGSGCGGDCGAVSREMKDLQTKLKQR